MVMSDLKNANILIVDDQIVNIKILEDLLEMQGYQNVAFTTDSREVAGLLSSFRPDLILLDLMMPHLNGFEVMEQIKDRLPLGTYLPILVLTADISTHSKQKALSLGAHDFLTKPFDLIEVGLRIRNLLFTGYIQKQIKQQNQLLEEKVKERTHELLESNNALLIAKNKAEASDRLKTAFMQNISHEIRTPLNGILGFSELLSDVDISTDERELYLELLRSSSNRLTNTITDYMDIALIVSDNLEVNFSAVDIIPLLHEIKSKHQSLCDIKNLTFNLIIPDEVASFFVQTDPELLTKILSHLVDNAIKFTHKGEIRLEIDLQKEGVAFYMKDTGIGVGLDSRERIFESFMQECTSNIREHEGSGLGLTIAQKLVTKIGGRLQIESEKGSGSNFFFTIPCSNKPEGTAAINRSEMNEQPLQLLFNRKIMVAEDDAVSACLIKKFVQPYSREVLHVKTGEEAVKICEQHPDIDLILMDVKMPEMDGLEAVKRIREFNQDVIIIVQTAYGLSGDRNKALESGCNDYISKPLNKQKLAGIIEKHLTNSSSNEQEN